MFCAVDKHSQYRRGVSGFDIDDRRLERRLTRVVIDSDEPDSEGPNTEKPLRRTRRTRALQETGDLPEPPPIPDSAREVDVGDGAGAGDGPPSIPRSSARTN